MNKAILSGICLMLAAQPCWADDSATDMLNQTYAVERGGQLTLDADQGDVEVDVASQNTVQIQVLREASSGSESDTKKLIKKNKIKFSQNGDEVRIESAMEQESHSWFSSEHATLKIHFKITVPRSYNANLNTGGGNITMAGLRGTVEARSSGGNLSFTNIEGPVNGHTSGGRIDASGCSQKLEIQSSGGDITINDYSGTSAQADTSGGNINVTGCSGKLSVKTSGGNITIRHFSGPAVFADTSGGAVALDLDQQPAGDCFARSSGGNITVKMPESLALKLNASTEGGTVSSAIPVTVEGKQTNDALEGKINGGGPMLSLRTGGGNIQLIKE
jgi:DUF4097 and DUF4098 domain-containing protein YvlB